MTVESVRHALGRVRDEARDWWIRLKAKRYGERPKCVHCGRHAMVVLEPGGEPICLMPGCYDAPNGPRYTRRIKPKDWLNGGDG